MLVYNLRAGNTWINSCSRTILFRKGTNWVPLTGTRYIQINGTWQPLTCSLPAVIDWSIDVSPNTLLVSTGVSFSFEFQYIHAGINVTYTAPDPLTLPSYFQSDENTEIHIQWNNKNYDLYLNGVKLPGDGTLYGSIYRFTPTAAFTISLFQI